MRTAANHDQNFRSLILDHPREALAFLAPEEAPDPDDDVRIVPVPQEQLRQRMGERFRDLDVPLLVKWTDGSREPLVFALAGETDPQRFSRRRLASYCAHLAELFDTDRVAPVAIFPHPTHPPGPLVLGSRRRDYIKFRFLTCRLADLSAGDWLDSDNVVARVNLPNMEGGGHDRVEVYAAAVRGVLALEADGGRRTRYLDLTDIYARLTEQEVRDYRLRYPAEAKAMVDALTPPGR